jgi:hypothetical protein
MTFQQKHIRTVKEYLDQFLIEIEPLILDHPLNTFQYLKNIKLDTMCFVIKNTNDIKIRATLLYNDSGSFADHCWHLCFDVIVEGDMIRVDMTHDGAEPDYSGCIKPMALRLSREINKRLSSPPASTTSTPDDTAYP